VSAAGARVLALDYGSARCGCALSDPTGTLATPAEPIADPRSPAGLARIDALVADREVGTIVVGLPLSLSGGDSAQTAEARAFAALLAQRLPAVEVRLHDERFTTRMARQEGGAASEDSRAAAHLLASWLAAPGR
jgi:putative Holliday junction resolvase